MVFIDGKCVELLRVPHHRWLIVYKLNCTCKLVYRGPVCSARPLFVYYQVVSNLVTLLVASC